MSKLAAEVAQVAQAALGVVEAYGLTLIALHVEGGSALAIVDPVDRHRVEGHGRSLGRDHFNFGGGVLVTFRRTA